MKKVGVHLRISVSHLLMNLKSNYLLKKLLKWANKNCKNFNIYNVVFPKKKIQKNTWRYHYFTPVHQTSWWHDLQFLDIECDRQKVVLMSHFLPFYLPLKPPKIIILHKCIKNHDNMLYCSWNIACDRCNFYFLFWAIFLPFLTPDSLKNRNFKKIIKKTSRRYHHFTNVYQNSWSDDQEILFGFGIFSILFAFKMCSTVASLTELLNSPKLKDISGWVWFNVHHNWPISVLKLFKSLSFWPIFLFWSVPSHYNFFYFINKFGLIEAKVILAILSYIKSQIFKYLNILAILNYIS